MTADNTKKKPIKLEWQGGLLANQEQTPVSLKGGTKEKPLVELPAQKIIGKVNLRIEKKGRAGSPVIILHQFSDAQARTEKNLKHLCSELKNKFACGGTVENGEIILMIRDLERVKKILLSDFDLKT